MKKDWGSLLTKMKDVEAKEKKEELVNETIREHRNDILLCPPIVKALHGVAPREIMGESKWHEVRNNCYESNKFHCLACGVHRSKALFHNWLEAHELYEIDYINKKYTLKEIVPLCHACHSYIHYQRTKAMLDCGKMNQEKYDTIMKHGDSVLVEVGLKKSDMILPKEHFPETYGGWSGWHLEYEGKKHYSRFDSVLEWMEFYERLNK